MWWEGELKTEICPRLSEVQVSKVSEMIEDNILSFVEVCSFGTKYVLADDITSNFLQAVFHKVYLIHSWILCPIWYINPSHATIIFLYTLKTSDNFLFYTPWKHQKAIGFLVFSRGMKWKFSEVFRVYRKRPIAWFRSVYPFELKNKAKKLFLKKNAETRINYPGI